MVSLIRSCLVYFSLTSVRVPLVEGHSRKYISLISNVDEHYRISNVRLILPYEDQYEIPKEWRIIHENETHMADLGKWTRKPGLDVMNHNLYTSHYQLDGIELRVIIVTNSFYYYEKNDQKYGFFVAVLKELQHHINFKMTLLCKQVNNPAAVEGVLESINNGEGDLYVGEFVITVDHRFLVDFTLPLFETRLVLIVKERKTSGVQWSTFFQVFSSWLWLTILFLIIGCAGFIVMVQVKRGLCLFLHGMSITLLDVWGVFCSQGIPVFPSKTSLRIIYYSILIASSIISAAYSGSLTSFITASTTNFQYSTLDEFAKDGSHSVTMLKSSVNWTMSRVREIATREKIKQLLRTEQYLPETLTEAFKQVCTEDVGFLTYTTKLYSIYMANHCKLQEIPIASGDNIGMIMPNGSPYIQAVNYYIQHFQENGMMSRLKRLYAPVLTEPKKESGQVNIYGVTPILLILVGGISIAVVIFICEKLYAVLSNLLSERLQENVDFRKRALQGKYNIGQHRLRTLRSPSRWQFDF